MGFGEEVTILEPVQVKQAYVESIMRIQKNIKNRLWDCEQFHV